VVHFPTYVWNEARLLVYRAKDHHRWIIEKHLLNIQHVLTNLDQTYVNALYELNKLILDRDKMKSKIDTINGKVQELIQIEFHRRLSEEPETLAFYEQERERIYAEWLPHHVYMEHQHIFHLKSEYQYIIRLITRLNKRVEELKTLYIKNKEMTYVCRENIIDTAIIGSLSKIRNVNFEKIADDISSSMSKVMDHSQEIHTIMDDAKVGIENTQREYDQVMNKYAQSTKERDVEEQLPPAPVRDPEDAAFLDGLFETLKAPPPPPPQQHMSRPKTAIPVGHYESNTYYTSPYHMRQQQQQQQPMYS
jgi:hypothetical protein